MVPSTQDNPKNRTTLFSIFGPAYIPEAHAEHDHLQYAVTRRDLAAIGVWAVIYMALVVVALIGIENAASLVDFAQALAR
jgi:cytochrome oxidase assembly protein ShyY1